MANILEKEKKKSLNITEELKVWLFYPLKTVVGHLISYFISLYKVIIQDWTLLDQWSTAQEFEFMNLDRPIS